MELEGEYPIDCNGMHFLTRPSGTMQTSDLPEMGTKKVHISLKKECKWSSSGCIAAQINGKICMLQLKMECVE